MNTCIFCQIAAHHPDHAELTVFANEHAFVQISLSQKRGNFGHVLVIPRRHIKDIYELPEDLDAPLMSALRLTAKAVKESFTADGVHIRQNNESASGQDVFHLHFHVIPRYHADRFEEKKYEEVGLGIRIEQVGILREAIERNLQQ